MVSNKNLENFKRSLVQFPEFLFESLIPIEAVTDSNGESITKILAYWRKMELLPFFPSGKHKFDLSFAEIIWLRILDTLRGFSFTNHQMGEVSDYFFKDAYKDELPKKNFLHNKKELEKKRDEGIISIEEEKKLQFINTGLENDNLLYVLRFEITYLTNLIRDYASSGEEKAILIYKDGRVAELHGDAHRTHSDFNVDPTESHIRIYLSNLFKEILNKKELKIFIPGLLSSKEKEFFKQVREQDVKEIAIEAKDGSTSLIEGSVRGEGVQQIPDLLATKQYHKITAKTPDGSCFYIEAAVPISKPK